MRRSALLLVMACGGGEPPPTTLVPESDAVLPPPFVGELALADGRALTLEGRELAGDLPLLPGELLGAPSLTPDGRRFAYAHRTPAGSALELVSLEASWQSTTVLESIMEIDRVALDPAGERVAFVWAGPRGGAAAVWTLDLPDGEPVRRTNLAPYTPGHPPADFVPLPVGHAPVWHGDTLRWTSHVGEHAVGVTP